MSSSVRWAFSIFQFIYTINLVFDQSFMLWFSIVYYGFDLWGWENMLLTCPQCFHYMFDTEVAQNIGRCQYCFRKFTEADLAFFAVKEESMKREEGWKKEFQEVYAADIKKFNKTLRMSLGTGVVLTIIFTFIAIYLHFRYRILSVELYSCSSHSIYCIICYAARCC